MTISFDGLRKNATRSMNSLHDELKEIIALDSYDTLTDEMKKQIIAKFNEAAMFVDSFNCLYDPENPNDMSDLSHLEIKRLDDLDENNELE